MILGLASVCSRAAGQLSVFSECSLSAASVFCQRRHSCKDGLYILRLLAGRINSSFSASWKRIPHSAKDTGSSILAVYPIKNPFGRSSLQFYSGTISCLITYSTLGTAGNAKVGGHDPTWRTAGSCAGDICMFTQTQMRVHAHTCSHLENNTPQCVLKKCEKIMALIVYGWEEIKEILISQKDFWTNWTWTGLWGQQGTEKFCDKKSGLVQGEILWVEY